MSKAQSSSLTGSTYSLPSSLSKEMVLHLVEVLKQYMYKWLLDFIESRCEVWLKETEL